MNKDVIIQLNEDSLFDLGDSEQKRFGESSRVIITQNKSRERIEEEEKKESEDVGVGMVNVEKVGKEKS
eukprot:CAMPEP_0114575978 /NCGR_PEP_ID=MMETSP0125-20121206/791_1 /TAXON_ID=485358 ORGANISM="Aristerostoma sp., Strain ATCC 50986" /NCGR_SAMPLE_ID=MMETSP0125 /ASSEMBLY_ACC=CAM_ASM_000245 /LENGTH=68 /DNA_ID=CAMNT_0001764135 /DNA_START=2076 /DNA_END=2282 /DNA_ORIENTATION=-